MDRSSSEAIAAEATQALPAGTRVGSYMLRALVAAGSRAHVYRAEHVVLGKEVALKLLAPAREGDAALEKRLLEEGRVAALVRHPNVVGVSDASSHGPRPYLVMELLFGDDLARRLQIEGALPNELTLEIGLGMAAALSTLHGHGIVHGNLEPRHVFLSRAASGRLVPKLLGFGRASAPRQAVRGALARDPELAQSPFVAPEVQSGKALDARADQYALGAILYACVTGAPPRADNPPNARALTARARRLDPTLARVIARALSPDPRERFDSLLELGTALLEVAPPRLRAAYGAMFPEPAPPSSLRGVESTPAVAVETKPEPAPPERTPRERRALTRVAAALLAVPVLYALPRLVEPAPSATLPPRRAASAKAPALPPAASLVHDAPRTSEHHAPRTHGPDVPRTHGPDVPTPSSSRSAPPPLVPRPPLTAPPSATSDTVTAPPSATSDTIAAQRTGPTRAPSATLPSVGDDARATKAPAPSAASPSAGGTVALRESPRAEPPRAERAARARASNGARDDVRRLFFGRGSKSAEPAAPRRTPPRSGGGP